MKNFACMFGLVVAALSTGCLKPYHEATLVNVNTSEVAVLVETVNDNGQAVIAPKGKEGETATQFYNERVVNARKVEIPYYWKQTKRVLIWAGPSTGKWTAGARLITIDTQPETREWPQGGPTAITVESKDSVGFSTGISMTARIKDKTDAIVFLSNYPPKTTRQITTEGGDPFNVEITALEQIMDQEIRNKVQEVYADEAGEFDMDILREQKREILDTVRAKVIPYFAERGIEITTIGQFGGFAYENPEIQNSIDKVFQAQQDEEVAIAESKAAEQRKLALKLEGEGEAAKVLEAKRGEAEGIKLVADAKAYELEKLNENPEAYIALKTLEVQSEQIGSWDGKLPVTLFGGSGAETPTLLMGIDSLTK